MPKKKFRLLRMHPKYWAAILLVLAFFFTAAYRSQQRQLEEMAQVIESMTAERDQLADDLMRLQRKINFTHTDKFIEREARSTMGWIYEGEILFKPAD